MNYRKRIFIVLCMLVSFLLFAENNFLVLKNTEDLNYDSVITSTDPYNEMVEIYAIGKEKRKICSINGSVLSEYKNVTNSSSKWLLLYIVSFDEPSESLNATQLWYFDGTNGYYKELLASSALTYSVSDDGAILCVEDLHQDSISNNTPIITLYDISTMKVLKRIVYDKYKNTPVSAHALKYKDGSFYFTLSDDGAHYSQEHVLIK